MEQEARRLKQSNNDPDSVATTLMQELFHTAHGAVAPYRANHPSITGTWIPERAMMRPVPARRVHLQAQPPSWCNMLLLSCPDPGVA